MWPMPAAGQHIGHVHFVDLNRLAAGFGHTHFAPIAEALRQIGFDHASAEALPLLIPTPLQPKPSKLIANTLPISP